MSDPLGDLTEGGRERGHVAFARLVPDPHSLFTSTESHSDLLRAALKTGELVERHRREWRMGKFEESWDFIVGRLGFTNAHGPTEVWSDDANDFVDEDFPNGCTSPFVIRVADLMVAFQLRSGQIRYQSFVGALQALMRETSGDSWTVEPYRREVTFGEWKESVSRVKTMTLHLKEPNPNFKDRPLVAKAIGETGSNLLKAVLSTDDDDLDGLDTEAEFIRQAVLHVEKGYGDFSAVGVRNDDEGIPRAVKYQSDGGETDVITVPADPESGEVAHEILRQQVGERLPDPEQESDGPA